ncbi:MAG: Uma2 family endonuclease [Chloroflexota bacterium]
MALQHPQPEPFYTVDEYLAYDRDADTKHEYASGEIVAMSCATYRHNQITGDLVIALGTALRGKCAVLPGDMRVRVKKANSYRYPDVTIVCGDPVIEDDNPGLLLNPAILIEVLSESTRSTDHITKLEEYLKIPGLQAYLIVSQDAAQVKAFQRQADGDEWVYS